MVGEPDTQRCNHRCCTKGWLLQHLGRPHFLITLKNVRNTIVLTMSKQPLESLMPMAWLHLFQVRKAELQLLCGLFMPQASTDACAYYVWLLCVDTCVLAVMAVCRHRCSLIALVSSLMPT